MTTTVTASPSQAVAGEVRAELARRGLSRRQFAALHGLNPQWLHRRLSPAADVSLSLEDVVLFAEALDVPVSTLLGSLPRLDSNQEPSGWTFPEVTLAA